MTNFNPESWYGKDKPLASEENLIQRLLQKAECLDEFCFLLEQYNLSTYLAQASDLWWEYIREE